MLFHRMLPIALAIHDVVHQVDSARGGYESHQRQPSPPDRLSALETPGEGHGSQDKEILRPLMRAKRHEYRA